MKLKNAIIATSLSILLLVVVQVSAIDWSKTSLSSGYAVTTDYHGVPEVPIGTDVTATAGTTEHPSVNRVPQFPNVTKVRFRWIPPSGSGLSEIYSPPLGDLAMSLWNSGEEYEDKDGNLWYIYIGEDTQTIPETIDAVGDWGVQAWFYDDAGKLRNQTGIEKIRATSFNAVPEVPFGTLAITTAMFGALILFTIKGRRKLPIS